MGFFGTAYCGGCGEKTLKSRLVEFETPEGPIRLCPGCLEIQTMKARRVAEYAEAWERVRRFGGSIVIEGYAAVDSTWQELPQEMITLDQVRALLDDLPIVDARKARLSTRAFALESARRPLMGVDLMQRDPSFLAQIVEAYSLEDMSDEAAGVLHGFLYEKVSVIPFLGDVDLMKKTYGFDKDGGRIIVSTEYLLAPGSKVSTAGGGIERPVKRMVTLRAGENRYVWCKFVDRDE
jgi:hypothetical protein